MVLWIGWFHSKKSSSKLEMLRNLLKGLLYEVMFYGASLSLYIYFIAQDMIDCRQFENQSSLHSSNDMKMNTCFCFLYFSVESLLVCVLYTKYVSFYHELLIMVLVLFIDCMRKILLDLFTFFFPWQINFYNWKVWKIVYIPCFNC